MPRRKAKSATQSGKQPEGYVLDRFGQDTLQIWNKHSNALDEYHIRLFYYLEGLRESHDEALIEALQNSSSKSINEDSWYRIVSYRYSTEALSPKGSLVNGGRFNIGSDLDSRKFPGFPALYLAENQETAYSEYFGAPRSKTPEKLSGHEFALQSESSFSVVRLSFKVDNIFDLTNARNLSEFSKIIGKFKVPQELKDLGRSIGIKSVMLVRTPVLLKDTLVTSDWRHYPVQYEIPANPQVFGRLLRNAGFEGVLYPSSRGQGKCLAILSENLDGSDSYIALADEAPANVEHIKIDSSNWKELSYFDGCA